MISEIIEALGCPELFIDCHPNKFVELIYDDGETETKASRIYVDSIEDLSVSNWISLSRSFIETSRLSSGLITLH